MAKHETFDHFSTHGSITTVDVAPKNQSPATDQRYEPSTEITIDQEDIPSFPDVRSKLLPLIKTDSWLKTTKELLQQINIGSQSVFFQPINRACRVNFGFTVAIVDGEQFHYVLNSYLAEWHISESTLTQIAQANLRKRLREDGENIWRKSETGIRFIQGLGPLAASVFLLTDVIEQLGIEDGDPVCMVPRSNLCMLGESKNVTQLCVMGEIALRFAKEPLFLSGQPLRLVGKQWQVFEANKANDEHPFPKSPDEVKMLKRALKMQGKI